MEFDKNEVQLLGVIGRVTHMIGKLARTMYSEYDLNMAQSRVLFVLHAEKSVSQKELAKQLNVTPPSITSMIKKMENDGYITRKVDPKDQRVMRLTLTEKGESLIEYVLKTADEMDKKVFGGMSAEEKMLFRRLLMQIIDNLE